MMLRARALLSMRVMRLLRRRLLRRRQLRRRRPRRVAAAAAAAVAPAAQPAAGRQEQPLKAFRGAALAPAKAVGVPDNLAGPLTLALAGVGAAVALGLGPFAGAAVSTAVADALAAEPEEEEVPATPSRDNSDDLWLDRQIDKAIDFLKGLLGRQIRRCGRPMLVAMRMSPL